MKHTSKLFLFSIILIAFSFCSTKKDTFISRNYHALNTKFNVLFNGEEAFKKGIEQINNEYKDNYFKQLPIEPIDFTALKKAPPVTSSDDLSRGFGFPSDKKGKENEEVEKPLTTFDRAEDKAVKAIQKHGMNINGIERNSQIDNAYLLLGKSRYYSQRFIPALEAFNYVIANYPNADLIAETHIWRAKANIRIGNEEQAIETLKLLLHVKDTVEVDLPDLIKEQAHTALAMAYVKADSLQNVKKHLTKATRTLNNRDQSARNLFILGQIYASENKKDSAIMLFDKLANFKKAPYRFKIHANIEMAKNFPKDSSSTVLLELLTKLVGNRDNRPYLDELYYHVGLIHEKNDSIHLAIKNYNKSLRAKNAGETQKTFTYENLGNIYFKNSEYQLAGSYFDSVLDLSKNNRELRIRKIRRKAKNLASLIKFEKLVTKNDSILKIASLSKSEQEIYFQKYIDDLKVKDEAAAQLKLNQLAFGSSFGGNSLQSREKGSWYFYNSESIGFGKTEFQKTWGNRQLKDNWRWSVDLSTGNLIANDSVQLNQKIVRYELSSYLKSIPTKKEELDTLKINRNQALYELGIIYKEQFKDSKLAIKRLERVEGLQPKPALILPINWHLYQVYTNLGNDKKAEKYKQVILTGYSDTSFAQRILNPDEDIKESLAVNKIKNTYKEVYYLYKEGKYKLVETSINNILPTVKDVEFLPKLMLLKAYAIGGFKDKEAYKKALEFVVISYGNTAQGKDAKKVLEQLNK